MERQGPALHEAMEIHEILNFKAVGLTKSQTMQILVSDGELRAIMQKDVEQSARAINDLQNLLSKVQLQR